ATGVATRALDLSGEGAVEVAGSGAPPRAAAVVEGDGDLGGFRGVVAGFRAVVDGYFLQ
ncbi:hypothetical protein Dimus_006476, partial [Dionaea muscipula]